MTTPKPVSPVERADSAREVIAPCPFCGGRAEVIHFEEEGDDNFGGSCICCTQCQASSPVHFDRKQNLYSSWNDRHVPAGYAVVPVETLRAVKVALESLVEEKCDYMRLNHLGDPEVQHTVKYGRAALAILTASDSGQEKGK